MKTKSLQEQNNILPNLREAARYPLENATVSLIQDDPHSGCEQVLNQKIPLSLEIDRTSKKNSMKVGFLLKFMTFIPLKILWINQTQFYDNYFLKKKS